MILGVIEKLHLADPDPYKVEQDYDMTRKMINRTLEIAESNGLMDLRHTRRRDNVSTVLYKVLSELPSSR